MVLFSFQLELQYGLPNEPVEKPYFLSVVLDRAVRYWWNRFGPLFAAQIRKRRTNRYGSHWQWHMDEMFVKIHGETYYLWRAVDHEGEVLDAYVTKSRDRYAALRFFRRVVMHREAPHAIVTDQLRSYTTAFKLAGVESQHRTGRYLNNRIENAHQPVRRREQAIQRFRRIPTLRKFAAIHASLYNHFNLERHLYGRQAFKRRRNLALSEWRRLCTG